MKPAALDLFCGAGGATKGLQDAGFFVIGVDIKPQPRYCGDGFIQADAMTFPIEGVDFVWASPPCQRFTQMLNHGRTDRNKHPDFIDSLRSSLQSSGLPFVIENVPGAPLIKPIMLCGEMFKLRVMRHRLFESNVKLEQPPHPRHNPRGGIRKQGDGGYYYRVYGHETGKHEWGNAMGTPWMKYWESAEAIPPAYSEFIGKQIIGYVQP